MGFRRFNSLPAPSNVLTPPWVEQYLYHLDQWIRRAQTRRFGFSFKKSFTFAHVDDVDFRLKCLIMRQMQHKEMKYALYQVGHPLWQRIE